jgi:uncharacterized protein DUF2878
VATAGAGHLEAGGTRPRGTRAEAFGRLGICFALGAILGTLLDGIHSYGDVLAYPHPAFGRWAWFVPLEFGLVGVGVGLVMPALERGLAPRAAPRWSPAERAAELFLFTGLYLSTAMIEPAAAPALALGMGALAATRLLVSRKPGDWVYVLAAAVLGPAAEAGLAALGVFEYLDPDFAGIPYWLPALWANGGLLIRRLLRPLVVG